MAISTEAKVGFVFFLGLAILAVSTIMVGQGELSLYKRGYTIDVVFPSVGGLRKNDSVELAGMEVGKVENLRIERDGVRVSLQLDEGVEIKRDSSISILEKSLLGGRIVSISMGSPGEDTVASGDTVKGKLVPAAAELVARASQMVEKLDETLNELEETMPKFASILGSMDEIAKKVEEGGGVLGKLISDEELGEKLEETLTELVDVAPKLGSMFESVERITKKIDRGEGTIGKLVVEETLYEDVSETLKTARVAGEKIAEFTERMEKVKTYIGLDSAYNEDSSQTLTKVYLRIEPRSHKFYLVGATALTGSGTEWDEKDEADMELDLQLGRRFLDNKLTGRIGLFETRIGAGIDYGFNDRFSLSLEGRNTWTREKDENIDPFLLRSRLQCRVWRGFYLHAGADNILDETAFNAGIRLEYSDEDIKYILSTLSIGK